MARRLLTPAARTRVRAVFREAPDHYELLDQRLVGQFAGFLFCCAGVIAAVLLALDPPTGTIGPRGWAPAALIILLAFVCGAVMLANRRILPTAVLSAIALSGPAMIATLQWLAGGGSAYVQLLILSIVWSGVVLPPLRLALVAGGQTVVVFLPAIYGRWQPETLPVRVATSAIIWTLALVCLVHAARIREVRRNLLGERAEADELARVDALTGLSNRRAMDEALVVQVALATRTARPLSALVADLDGFKQINDRFGHHAGDRVLHDVAAVMRDVVRTPDSCFRWGGDEFVILLAEVDLGGAEEIAERVATAIAQRCTTPDGLPAGITFGAAQHVSGQTGSRLLAIADAALLAAKAGARQA